MTLSALGIFSAAGAGGVAVSSDYELISSTFLTGTQASVSFDVSSFALTYRHLQIRAVVRGTHAANLLAIRFAANGVGGTSYSLHGLYGNASVVASYAASSQPTSYSGLMTGANAAANNFGASVIEIHEAFSSTKNKTIRTLGGIANHEVSLQSGAFLSTASISSIVLTPDAGSFAANSRFSIYGIKG